MNEDDDDDDTHDAHSNHARDDDADPAIRRRELRALVADPQKHGLKVNFLLDNPAKQQMGGGQAMLKLLRWQRYSKYRVATTLGEAKELGASDKVRWVLGFQGKALWP
jgi:hypothetical protein